MKIFSLGLGVVVAVLGLNVGRAQASPAVAQVVCANSEQGFNTTDENVGKVTERLNEKIASLVRQGYDISAPSQTITSGNTLVVCVTAAKPRS